jgi:hypothetical protein
VIGGETRERRAAEKDFLTAESAAPGLPRPRRSGYPAGLSNHPGSHVGLRELGAGPERDGA